MDTTRMRTWAEISLGNLAHNYTRLRARLPMGTRFLGVVKADAYGHGGPVIARKLTELGAEMLAVGCLSEAITLREAGIEAPILIFGVTPPAFTAELARLRLTQTVGSLEEAEALSRHCAEHSGRLTVHLKLDTGMGRLGFSPEADGEAARAVRLPGLDFEGIYTHFAVADMPGDGFTQGQLQNFLARAAGIEGAGGVKFAIRHCANSGAVVNCSLTYLDMVRPGIALYGGYSDEENGDGGFLPVMTLKTRVAAVRALRPGDTVSYGRTFTADRPCTVAVLGIGYADGLHRSLSGGAEFLLRGRRVRQIGRICMDLCMADVTDVPGVCPGDVVTIFGQDGADTASLARLADQAGTISYELLCAVSGRVPRVYI